MKTHAVAALLLAALLCFLQVGQAQGSLALVYDAVGDSGFGHMALLGAEPAARDFGVAAASVLVNAPSEYAPTVRRLAASGEHEVIIAVGFQFAGAIALAASEFPGQKFALIDAEVDAPNVLSIIFADHEGGALAGALAALVALESGSDSVGMVLGIDSPPIRRFAEGYAWGARWALDRYNERNADASPASIRVLADYAGSFSEPELGKKTAQAQLEQGAAVVFHAAGATGLGIFAAVKEAAQAAGKRAGPPFAIGVDGVQEYLAPGFVPASVVKRVDVAVYTAAERALTGTFAGGTLLLDLASGGISLSTDESLDALETAAAQAGFSDAAARAEAEALVEEARRAVPAYIWELVAELERGIKEGAVALP